MRFAHIMIVGAVLGLSAAAFGGTTKFDCGDKDKSDLHCRESNKDSTCKDDKKDKPSDDCKLTTYTTDGKGDSDCHKKDSITDCKKPVCVIKHNGCDKDDKCHVPSVLDKCGDDKKPKDCSPIPCCHSHPCWPPCPGKNPGGNCGGGSSCAVPLPPAAHAGFAMLALLAGGTVVRRVRAAVA